MQEYVGLLGMPEEEEAAVAMTSKYSGKTCDDEKSKKLATVQPPLLHHYLTVNSQLSHLVNWKT